MSKEKVIVIDFGGVQYTAITVCKKIGRTPVTYIIMRMIIGYLKKLNADIDTLVIIVQDYDSWRKDIDKNYKAQRKAIRDKFADEQFWKEKFEEINNFIPKLNISLHWHWIKLYKMEADDIASVACRYYKNKEVILVSSDRDWEQLAIFPNVKIFSPLQNKKTKVPKFKDIPYPMKVLMEKIQGDISDNLLEKPSSEAEFERRKMIVDLTQLPDFVEKPIKIELDKIMPKNIYLHKIPFKSIVVEIKKLYKLGE